MTIIAILSLYLSYGLSALIEYPDYLLADLWCVMAAVIVLQASIGKNYKAVCLHFIGVLIGSISKRFFLST